MVDRESDFDVSELNRNLDRSKGRSRLFVPIFISFVVIFAGYFVWLYGVPLAQGHFDPYRLTILVMVLTFTVFFVPTIAGGLAGFRPGIQSVGVGSEGLRLIYGTAKIHLLHWDDSSISFELLAYPEGIASAALVVPSRYYVLTDGRMSALTEAAYSTILRECESRRLIRGSRIGDPWYKLTLGSPLIHEVRGGQPG